MHLLEPFQQKLFLYRGAQKNVYSLQLAKYLRKNVIAKLIHTPGDDCDT
jgi:hypothetical protein